MKGDESTLFPLKLYLWSLVLINHYTRGGSALETAIDGDKHILNAAIL